MGWPARNRRWRRCGHVLVLPAVAAAIGGDRASAAVRPPLAILLEPDGTEHSAIPVAVRPGATDAEVLFYLRSGGALPVTEVRLRAVLDGVPVQFTVPAADAQGTFDVPTDKTVDIIAKVTSVRAGLHSARLDAIVDGRAHRIGRLGVEKPAEAAVSVDAPGPTGVKLTTPVAAFAHEFQLVSTKDEPVTDLVIGVSRSRTRAAFRPTRRCGSAVRHWIQRASTSWGSGRCSRSR